jgi:taurine dioxygenase
MTESISIQRVTGVLGAEVSGVDISKALSDSEAAQIRQALNDHKVLIFRDQPITPQQQYDFALNFGEVEAGKIDAGNSPVPGINVVHSMHSRNLTDQWHTDHTFSEIPPMAGMLHAVQLPSAGGDTLFANMVAAYDALSEQMKLFLDGLTATFSLDRLMRRFAEERKDKTFDYTMDKHSVVHPIVRVHPETGLKSLFLCEIHTSHINELSKAESRAVLQFLYRHIASTEFQMRVKWELHSSVMWDERSTLHFAMPDYDEPRVLHRLMIGGTRPFGTRGVPEGKSTPFVQAAE